METNSSIPIFRVNREIIKQKKSTKTTMNRNSKQSIQGVFNHLALRVSTIIKDKRIIPSVLFVANPFTMEIPYKEK